MIKFLFFSQVIPVLVKGTDIKTMPDHYKWTTLLKEDEPNYLKKLWKAMNGSYISCYLF